MSKDIDIEIVDSPRPDYDDEDKVLLRDFRLALEACADALRLPGSPDLTAAVPREVKRLIERAQLTREESYILRSLGEIYNSITSLPNLHPRDSVDVEFHVHGLQRIVMSRLARRLDRSLR